MGEDYGYTMLTAWHKFDKYERAYLCEIMECDSHKLMTTSLQEVFWKLIYAEKNMQREGVFPHPVARYRKRLVLAIQQQRNKRRMRIKGT